MEDELCTSFWIRRNKDNEVSRLKVRITELERAANTTRAVSITPAATPPEVRDEPVSDRGGRVICREGPTSRCLHS